MSILKWGYHAGLPKNAETAWGCRAIVNDPDNSVDVLSDRQEGTGPRINQLLEHLNTHVRGVWRQRATNLINAGVLRHRQLAEATVYEDTLITIKANTNGSGGYLYVCAFFRDEGTDHD